MKGRSRRKWVPSLGLLVLAAAVACVLWAQSKGELFGREDNSEAKKGPGERRLPVVVSRATTRRFEARLTVQGTVEAKTFANVASRVPGTIEAIFVDEGDTVVAGKSRLFQIDALNLKRVVDIKRQELAVADCSVREKEAGLEQIEAELCKVKIDLERHRKLHEKGFVSKDVVEQYESRYKQSKALEKHALSLVDLGREQKRQAEVALSIAEKDLRDSLVYAPITGTVSQRFQEVGEMGEVGKPVLRVENTSVVEVSAFLPAECYARIHPGLTPIRLLVSGRDMGTYPISYRSPTIDPNLRTFEIKSIIKDPPEDVVPGAMARLSVILEQRTGPAVPSTAVQERGGRPVVFVVKDGKATMVDIERGLETDGYIEVKNGMLAEGTPVVVQGQVFLKESSPVTVQEEGA